MRRYRFGDSTKLQNPIRSGLDIIAARTLCDADEAEQREAKLVQKPPEVILQHSWQLFLKELLKNYSPLLKRWTSKRRFD